MKIWDVAIIGGGTAGLSAAIYVARAGLSTCVIEKEFVGGQIVNSPDVENYPAVAKTSGFAFVMGLQEQAASFGAEIIYDSIVSCALSGEIKTLQLSATELQAKTVILATGAAHRKLNVPGEEQFLGRGVSYCATCDGNFFRGKTACVVGGGETAFEDALYLAGICEKVYLIHRRDTFRAAASAVDKLKVCENVEFVTPAVPTKIVGDTRVSAILLEQNGMQKEILTDAVFVAVGMQPQNELFAPWVDLDEGGYFAADESCTTKTAGVFVAGDARSKPLRQLVTAASDGAVAANAAIHAVRG